MVDRPRVELELPSYQEGVQTPTLPVVKLKIKWMRVSDSNRRSLGQGGMSPFTLATCITRIMKKRNGLGKLLRRPSEESSRSRYYTTAPPAFARFMAFVMVPVFSIESVLLLMLMYLDKVVMSRPSGQKVMLPLS